MALESADFIGGLVHTNPVGATDDRSTSDDHHRLGKKVLKNSFAGHLGVISAYGAMTGTNTYAMTVSAPSTLAYINSMTLIGIPANTNTSTSVSNNLNTLGAKTVVRADGLLALGIFKPMFLQSWFMMQTRIS